MSMFSQTLVHLFTHDAPPFYLNALQSTEQTGGGCFLADCG